MFALFCQRSPLNHSALFGSKNVMVSFGSALCSFSAAVVYSSQVVGIGTSYFLKMSVRTYMAIGPVSCGRANTPVLPKLACDQVHGTNLDSASAAVLQAEASTKASWERRVGNWS